jgi:hypothetical protein
MNRSSSGATPANTASKSESPTCGHSSIAWGVRRGRGAIGLVIDGDYLEIGFPPGEAPKPKRQEGNKRK